MLLALPNNLSHKDVVKALEKAGFKIDGGTKGHTKMKKPKMSAEDTVKIAIIPIHGEIATGTLRSIVEQAGLSREEFLRLLH
jgi:predicted RNA binding protein YcfA (HicA-like mRNA interferase family)